MRGYQLYNFPMFIQAGNALREMGLTVHNPAEMDLAAGVDPFDEVHAPDIREALYRDTAAICRCGTCFLLPGWEKSKGVFVETVLGTELGLEFYEILSLQSDLMEFRPVTYKEIYERSWTLHRPRGVSEVQQSGQPCTLLRWVRQVLHSGLWLLGIVTSLPVPIT